MAFRNNKINEVRKDFVLKYFIFGRLSSITVVMVYVHFILLLYKSNCKQLKLFSPSYQHLLPEVGPFLIFLKETFLFISGKVHCCIALVGHVFSCQSSFHIDILDCFY